MMRSKKKEGALKPSRKLDKRSSRGVMFENEELRMRTIEINAEVDRGQSDLRKLKKENETLKQQVWTLRDEYDKLENFVKNMDGDSDEDDDDDDEDEDEELEQRFCRPKINEEEGEDDDDEEANVETDNLENLQKVYSGKMRSVEYTMRQAATMESGLAGGCSQAQCGGGPGSAACAAPVDGLAQPGSVRVCVPDDTPAFVDVGEGGTSSPPDPLQPRTSETYLSQTDHFNLDQLLDFASSFHYDRRKHLAEEPLAMALPPEEERPASPSRDKVIPDPNYSTVRRRSATVIEKLKSGANSGALVKEVKQLSLCKDGATGTSSVPVSESPEVTHTTTVNYSRSSYFFSGPLNGSRSQSLGTGLNSAAGVRPPTSPAGPLYSSSIASNIGTSSSLDAGLPLVSVYNPRASLVRLNSIEPNTIMVSVAEMPQLWDITTQEIIDELEQQAEGTLLSIRGVRVVGRAAYISLGCRDALQQLLHHGLTVRGGKVPLIDITRESIVLALTGVPHYIADATLVILLSAFGTIIGELERRFYKGVDTGERFVRMKLKKHVKLPKYVTVGGCRIVLTVHGRDAPAQLHVPEWGTKLSPAPAPPPTPHPTHAPHPSDNPHTDLTTPISPDSGQCSEPSSSDKSCERILEGRDGMSRTDASAQSDARMNTKSSKTFSSRCIVNLKLPERPAAATALPRVREGINPRDPVGPCQSGGGLVVSATPATPMAAGHVLRAGSLYRGPRGPDTPSTTAGTGGGSPVSGRRHSRLGIDCRPPESPRPRPNSVVFEEQPREVAAASRGLLTPQYHSHVVASSSGPMPLANGILRKASGSEQEALLPATQRCAASIRNRLKIGRSMSYDAGKQKLAAEKEKKKLNKMESISENTINDDVSDITPLGAGARRDSEKSSVSANSKSSSNTNRKKEPAIDLPWCGCWGNGCF
ncbi:hypothetical protein OTU49_003423 [Cherax quadricarinatus]|uniref:Uncharacterized protein n=1 Tax=Cherax quadricarinatus TaxID=27406 RepID=A0AAW0X5A7_CHEQU|nr:uncharacterized protein LOC128691390 [Cherax quadricarinatus]XP_053636221.1 uncharacterized protein LOC128691390 [Cherax quadricarinatus]